MEKNIKNLLTEKIGLSGHMISASKSSYRNRFPDHLVVFNSNICTKEDGKVWFGDIDVSLSRDLLGEISISTGRVIYVLHEMDARFENEESPLFEEAVVKFLPDGTFSIKYKDLEFKNL